MSSTDTIRVNTGRTSYGAVSATPIADKAVDMAKASTIDEDSSSASSSSPEIFDRSFSKSVPKASWSIDTSGDRHRYGSSASSTGISSICSSISAEEVTGDVSVPTSSSKKRMANGTLKHASAGQPIAISPTNAISLPTEDVQPPLKTAKRRGRPPKSSLLALESSSSYSTNMSPLFNPIAGVRPRASIPSRLPTEVLASQCIEAAYASRLDPYALSAGEHRLLADMLMPKDVTVYLNIRNAILRLWKQNPMCSITLEEALGCAKESRFFGLAEVAYKWLIRNGYVNFGCVEIPQDLSLPKRMNMNCKQRKVVVVGAGVSGLTAARQLENFFAQDAARWITMGEQPPQVIVLEGRQRVGGRVFSKPLRSQVKNSLPDDLRNTAEMGAMIVTGFERGNPLDTVIRGQLGLRYHMMKDALTIYDCNGRPIDEKRDLLNTDLYTDISDRAGAFRTITQRPDTLRGDEDLINRFRDPVPDGFANSQLEPLPTEHIRTHQQATRRGRRRNAPPGTEKLTGRSQVVEGASATQSACRAAKTMGWQVRGGVAKNQNIALAHVAAANDYPTLGSVMDAAIMQYQELIDLTPQDMRLLNWHHANLEYANAAPVSWLSLSGHDQDTGNEFEGAHSEVIGGYTQVPRGLMNLPTKLDVRFGRTVDSIHYDDGDADSGSLTTKVVCTDGEVIEADNVVVTAPLGVLKSGMIDFDPPLPRWKQGAIARMGFGLLNKVVLLYESPFWDDNRDMFGLLNEAEQRDSLDPTHYERRRGRFYLIWNASKISGRPMLIALMAGMAAHDAEITDTPTLLSEVSERLRGVYGKHVPEPLEVIVTRWKKDPFTRGTYSYVGPQTRPGDYDLMATPVGNLHFAGEATCGTHPATVHGAFLSGLRVASEVMETMTGPIMLPDPLVGPGVVKREVAAGKIAPTLSGTVGIPETGSGGIERFASPAIKQEPDLGPDASMILNVPTSNATRKAKPKGSSAGFTLALGPPPKSVCANDSSFWATPSSGAAHAKNEGDIVAAVLSQIGERPAKPARPGVNPFLLYAKANWEMCKAQCSREQASSGRDMIRSTLGKWWKAAGDDIKQPYIVQSQAAQETADAARRAWETKVAWWDSESARIRHEYLRGQASSLSAASAT